MKLQNLNTNDPWMLGEDIPDCDLFFSTLWLHCFVNEFAKHTGRAYTKILCKYEGYHLWFYFGEKDSFEVGENIVGRIVNEKGYAGNINKNIVKQADNLRRYSETIPQNNLDKLSNEELWNIYDTHQKLHSEYYTWCWIPVAADMFHNNLTNRVKQYLREIDVAEEKINEYFITLTQPTKKSLIFLEQQDLLKIGTKGEKYRKKLLQKHWQKYYYTKHLWVKGENTVEDYQDQLEDILRGTETCQEIIKRQELELKLSVQKKKELLKELKINKQWRDIFYAFGDFMVTKIYRRYAQLFAVHHMSAILKEIARRLYMTEKQVRFMLPHEVKEAFFHNTYNTQELLERTKLCVYYAEKNIDQIFIHKQAEKFLGQIKTNNIDCEVKELRGEVGCPGFAKGKVKVIIRAQDMDKMEEGDILVSIATDPDIVPAMKKASAIITEQGGVTSHAAIVSRELGIPCVIGTKIATKVLKDGDEVEVDANKGIVKKL